MSRTINKKQIIILSLLCLGIMLRYMISSLGYNYDFESYCIVGEIAGNFRNVYSETYRYNYAPIFLFIQGLLYRISQVNSDSWILIYRILIVTVLTITDLGIAAFLASKYSYLNALLFFLNPVSIIITGYHNQFDNIAVLFALLSTLFFNSDKEINKKDIIFVVLFSLSLCTKHILFLFPFFILFMDKLPINKKILYAIVPPGIFLLSFIPFAISSDEAFWGIVNNVFRYRSMNNAPLLSYFYNIINFPSEPRIIIYGILMIITAWIIRKLRFDYIVMIYLISMVAFSSAIANQYLVIPMAALCVLNVGAWKNIYMIITSIYLLLDENGLRLLNKIRYLALGSLFDIVGSFFVDNGYFITAWILLFSLIYLYRTYKSNNDFISYVKIPRFIDSANQV